MAIEDWSTTPSDNDDADIANGIDWRELMAAGQVNNSARAMMAEIAKYRDSVANGTVLDGRYIKTDGSNFGAFGFRNRIINGGFDIDQRGVAATWVGPFVYGPDRWGLYATGTASLARFATPDYGGRYCGNISASNIAANGFVDFRQRIEAANIADLAGKVCTLSFKCAASVTGGGFTGHVYIGVNGAADNFAGTTFPIDLAYPIDSTPTLRTVTFTMPAGATNGAEILIRLTKDGTAGTNLIFNIGAVQLEQGAIATPFERRPIGLELALCQRYYQKSYSQGDALGAVTTSGAVRFRADGSSTGQFISVTLPVTMRAAPTLTPYSTETGESAKIYNYSSGNAVSCTLAGGGDRGFNSVTVGGSPADSNSYGFHYTADAEL